MLSNARIKALIGGTGTGKTFLLPLALHWALQNKPNGRFIISSPTYNMMLQNPINYVERWLIGHGVKYRLNKSTMELTIDGMDAVIYFRSAENPKAMQGIHADAILGDEAGLYSREWYDTAVQRLGYTGGTLWLLTTPYSLNWLKSEVYDKADGVNIQVENPTSKDNPYYPKKNIAHAKASLPDWKFRMLFEGVFTKASGLIYPEYETVEPFEIPSSAYRFAGLDFGFNNASAYIEFAEIDGTFYAIQEKKAGNLSEDDLYNLWLKDKRCPIYADPASKQTLEGLRRRGLNIREAKKEVLSGILLVSGMVRSGRVKIFRTLTKTIDELANYQWEMDKTENLIDKPKKENDHIMDAFRYALVTHLPPIKPTIRANY